MAHVQPAVPGSPDTSFGDNGERSLPQIADTDRFITDVAIHDDTITVCGLTGDHEQSRYTLLRFDDKGDLDPTFGNKGIVFGTFDPVAESGAEAIVVDANAKIWMLGWVNSAGKPHRLVVARFDAQGALDTSYASPYGYLALDQGNSLHLKLHSTSLQLRAGHLLASATLESDWLATHACVYRLDLAGNAGFPSGQFIEITHPSGTVQIANVIAQESTFLVAGTLRNGPETRGFIARFRNDGTPDPSFGDRYGFKLYESPLSRWLRWLPRWLRWLAPRRNANIRFNTLIQRPDGQLIVAGNLPGERPEDTNAMTWQFDAEGVRDATYNHGNPTVLTFNTHTEDEWEAAALHQDGKLVVFGLGGQRIYRARYTVHGRLDTAFGNQGIAFQDYPKDRKMIAVAMTPAATLIGLNSQHAWGFSGLLARFRN